MTGNGGAGLWMAYVSAWLIAPERPVRKFEKKGWWLFATYD
jgi:hypothetical protein